MERLSDDELANLFRLQENTDMLDLFNTLVKSHIDQYSKYLSNIVTTRLIEFKVRFHRDHNTEIHKQTSWFSHKLCNYQLGEHLIVLRVTAWNDNYRFFPNVAVALPDYRMDFNDELWKNYLNVDKYGYYNNIEQCLKYDSQKLYKYTHSLIKTLLLLTVNKRIN